MIIRGCAVIILRFSPSAEEGGRILIYLPGLSALTLQVLKRFLATGILVSNLLTEGKTDFSQRQPEVVTEMGKKKEGSFEKPSLLWRTSERR